MGKIYKSMFLKTTYIKYAKIKWAYFTTKDEKCKRLLNIWITQKNVCCHRNLVLIHMMYLHSLRYEMTKKRYFQSNQN